MTTSFDPAHLLPEASLNQTVLPAVPGVPLDLVGRNGIDLLGAPALVGVGVAATATRLAALLAALHRGDPSTGLGVTPSPWRRAYLDYWRGVREVWLGGGTVERLGAALGNEATAALDRAGLTIDVRVADRPGVMPLVGAGRSLASRGVVAVLDLGHTWVKRGVASFDRDGDLTELRLLPRLAVDPDRSRAEAVVAFVRGAMDSVLAAAPNANAAAVSVAAYVDPAGAIADSRSYYEPIAGAATEELRALVTTRVGPHAELAFLHDGTAAALAVSPTRLPAAAITIGTALGVGFVP